MPTIDYRPPEPPSDLKWQWERVKEIAVALSVAALIYLGIIWFFSPRTAQPPPPPPIPTTAGTSY